MAAAIPYMQMPTWAKQQFAARGFEREDFVGFLTEATAQPETIVVRLTDDEMVTLRRGPMD